MSRLKMKECVVVTGAAGFIGSHLSDHLLEQGYKVIGIDNMRTGLMRNVERAVENASFELMEEDVCNPSLKDKIEEKVDIIFHFAAISSVKLSIVDPFLVHEVNVEGTLNMLDFATEKGASRFILASSAAVYGNPTSLPVTENSPVYPLSPYAASKLSAEMYSLAFGESYLVNPTILRYFNVYGPRQENSEYSGVIPIFISQALTDSPLTIDGDGSQTRSFIHIDDVVKATLLAARNPETRFQTLNVSGTESTSILELAHLIKNYTPESDSEIVYRPPRKGDVKDSIGSIDKLSKLLNFTPEVSLETGPDRTVSWYELNMST
ncbi:MAG: NAD-dependent epimerase/dehydratase family protein [Candidatus Thorarchaeota archaeon]